MRYIGNKETLIGPIIQLLADKGLHQRNMAFFDAFCGMGSVSDSIKTLYDHIIIIIDCEVGRNFCSVMSCKEE